MATDLTLHPLDTSPSSASFHAIPAVARKVALDLLLQAAKDMSHRQFIFITPQNLDSITPDPDRVRIHKLKPPERGQTTLNVTRAAR